MEQTEPPVLTDKEIYDIVQPLRQRAAIVRYFRKNGFPDCRLKPNGMPLIPRKLIDGTALKSEDAPVELDFSKLYG